MSSIWFNVAIFCRVCWIWTQANGETYLMNVSLAWNESRKYCEGIGKTFFDATDNDSLAVLNSILNKSNEAWVAATVELSHFITQPVCMETNGLQFNLREQFNTGMIAKCLKLCKVYRYFGLKENDCFCFSNTNNTNRSAVCNYKCKNDPLHLCGGYESISLYEKVNNLITQKIAHSSKECVYARNTNKNTDLFTASCVSYFADGGMCEGGNDTACETLKWKPLGKQLCRMDLPVPFGWTQTRQICADIGGRLLTSNIRSSHMKTNLTYWLGFHRIGTIHEADDLQFYKNDTYCAVARKVQDFVLIEGEDCLKKHAILCRDKENPDNAASLGTHTTGKISNSDETDDTSSYVAAVISAILVIAIGFTALACAIRRRQKSRLKELDKTDSSGVQHTWIKRQSTNPPVKAQRKTHSKNEHVQCSYENVVFARSEQATMVNNIGHSNSRKETFDIIDLDKEHGEDKDNTEEDPHVYHHKFLHINVYDQTVLSGDKSPILDETYDRATLSQQLETTYFIIGGEGDVDSVSCKPVNNDYDTTYGQN